MIAVGAAVIGVVVVVMSQARELNGREDASRVAPYQRRNGSCCCFSS